MKQKDILIILILFFILSLIWIGGSIYHSGVNSTISKNTSRDIAPIDPAFDTKTIDKLKSRKKIAPSFDLESVTPTPIVLPTLPPSANASQGGKLLL